MNKSAIIVMLAVFFLLPGSAVAGFTDNGNGTVTDATTNLVWQQCSAGYTTTTTKCDTASGATTYIWEPAISYCEELLLGGFTDWRLPNIKELRSIVDSTKATTPVINTTYFPAEASWSYWSSTTYAYAPSITNAWSVTLNDGNVYYYAKTNSYQVRCVRGQ